MRDYPYQPIKIDGWVKVLTVAGAVLLVLEFVKAPRSSPFRILSTRRRRRSR